MQYVNALSPPIAGERVGLEGWGGNGHLLEAYSTKPTCKPQSTMCSFWDLRRYAVAVVAVAVAGRDKLKNVIQSAVTGDAIGTDRHSDVFESCNLDLWPLGSKINHRSGCLKIITFTKFGDNIA